MTIHGVPRPRRPFIAFPGHAGRSLRSPATQAAAGRSFAGAHSLASGALALTRSQLIREAE
jgi:hypothetical protein